MDVTFAIIRLDANWFYFLLENTVVFYYADCFRSHLRAVINAIGFIEIFVASNSLRNILFFLLLRGKERFIHLQ